MSRKSKSSAPRRSRPRFVHTPVSAVIGMLALAVIGVALIRGRLDLAGAGERAGAVLMVAILVDNLVAPVVQLVLPRAARETDTID
ncbi:MAG TPA: hypothetical protein VHE56_02305 [Mycobacteriales bacterium]|nr:hypothetical protein [Mycobacteriales bacterium]